jgi:hypothetical protein
MANLLILFQANTEATEQLALAVAVGAVEAEANIRLRRLLLPGAPEIGHKGYGKLQPADLLWAHTVVVGLESTDPVPPELNPFLEMLRDLPADLAAGSQKRVWTFHAASLGESSTAAQSLVLAACSAAGIQPLELPQSPLATPEERIAAMKQAGRHCAQPAN